MPGSTVTLGLPYPIPDDTVDVPRDIKALADKLDPLGTVPPGCMMLWPTAAAPNGWLVCNGQQVSAATYPQLATLLGQAGGLVTLPNLGGKLPLGASATRALGTTGGVETVALSAAQTAIRNHSHSGTTGQENSSLAHGHGDNVGDGYAVPASPGSGSWGMPAPVACQTLTFQNNAGLIGGGVFTGGPPAHNHNFGTSNPDGGEANGSAHENMPPYLAVNYIMRAG